MRKQQAEEESKRKMELKIKENAPEDALDAIIAASIASLTR